jgi:hypothetical protein
VTVFGILAEAGRLYVRFFRHGLLIAAPLFVVLAILAAILNFRLAAVDFGPARSS